MRASRLLLFGFLITIAVGCHTGGNSVAASSVSPTSTAVGPVPGANVSLIHYRTNPLNGDVVALQDGRRLFDWYNCSGCHGGHAGGGMGPSLRDETWIYGNRDDQIFDTIAQGRANGMPAWGSKIPEQQIWELVAYIKSMRKPQEPDPPVEPADEVVSDPNKFMPPNVGTKTTDTPSANRP